MITDTILSTVINCTQYTLLSTVMYCTQYFKNSVKVQDQAAKYVLENENSNKSVREGSYIY